MTLLALDGATLARGAATLGPFTLQVAAGERVAVVGPSGAGKSSLLKLAAGEWAPQAGTVRLHGRPLAAWPRAALAGARAVLPQQHTVAFGLPVELVVALGRAGLDTDPHRAATVRAALALAQAAHLAGRRFDTLSGGEQARVQLARVMAQLWHAEGGLLLADEPLAALDPGLQLELLDAMTGFAAARGHALVAVVHDLNHALGGFRRLWLLRAGALQADLPANRGAVPALASLFGVVLHCVDDGGGGLAVVARRPAATAEPA